MDMVANGQEARRGATQAHHGYLFANARHTHIKLAGARRLWCVVRGAAAGRRRLRVPAQASPARFPMRAQRGMSARFNNSSRHRNGKSTSLSGIATDHLRWRNPIQRNALTRTLILGIQVKLHVLDPRVSKEHQGPVDVENFDADLSPRLHDWVVAGDNEAAAAIAMDVVASLDQRGSTRGRLRAATGDLSVPVFVVSQTGFPFIEGSAPHAFNGRTELIALQRCRERRGRRDT